MRKEGGGLQPVGKWTWEKDQLLPHADLWGQESSWPASRGLTVAAETPAPHSSEHLGASLIQVAAEQHHPTTRVFSNGSGDISEKEGDNTSGKRAGSMTAELGQPVKGGSGTVKAGRGGGGGGGWWGCGGGAGGVGAEQGRGERGSG